VIPVPDGAGVDWRALLQAHWPLPALAGLLLARLAERRPGQAKRTRGRVVDVLLVAAVVIPAWYLWVIPFWACAMAGAGLVGLYSLTQPGLPDHFLRRAFDAFGLGACLWAYRRAGWTGVGLTVAGFLLSAWAIDAFEKRWRRRGIDEQYRRVRAERRSQPGWTGRECMACGKPVPPSVKPGDHCPHCHKQFAREVAVR
jgi:hypothetical protein